jgi:hypothetical protein
LTRRSDSRASGVEEAPFVAEDGIVKCGGGVLAVNLGNCRARQ